MRQYRIREEVDGEWKYIPQYSDDTVNWKGFIMMGGDDRFRTMLDAIELIKEDIEFQRKQKELEDRVIYHPYPL